MSIIKWLVPFVLTTATLAVPGIATAQRSETAATQGATSATTTSARLAALREGARQIDTRAKAIRVRMETADPRLRRHSKKLLVTVDEGHLSIVTRLEILQRWKMDADEEMIRSMEETYREAIKLLARVESWYQPPKRPA